MGSVSAPRTPPTAASAGESGETRAAGETRPAGEGRVAGAMAGARAVARHARAVAPPTFFDLALVAAGLALSLPLVAPGTDPPLAESLLAAGQVLALVFARRHPGRVLVTILVLGVPLLFIAPYLVSFGPADLALCALAWKRPPRISLRGLAALLALAPLNHLEGGSAQVLLAMFGAGLSWTLGELGRVREVRADEAKERARADERARIARELHDVLAHSLSVIVVQSTAANDVFDAQPEAAHAALETIEEAGRTALQDLRRVLDGVHALEPQPSLRRLDGLAKSVRAAGLDVALRIDGEPDELPAVVEVSGYRIIQEALTNAVRHARARRVEVAVRYSATDVAITVTDDGHGTPAPEGRGILGMRERAALLGGTLEAAPHGHGFRVAATLPRR